MSQITAQPCIVCKIPTQPSQITAATCQCQPYIHDACAKIWPHNIKCPACNLVYNTDRTTTRLLEPHPVSTQIESRHVWTRAFIIEMAQLLFWRCFIPVASIIIFFIVIDRYTKK